MSLLLDEEEETLEAALAFVDAATESPPPPDASAVPPSTGTDTLSISLDLGLNQLTVDAVLPDDTDGSSALLQAVLEPSPSSSNAPKTKSCKKKTRRRPQANPNRARDERKHELAYLRVKVEQLQLELRLLQRRRQDTSVVQEKSTAMQSANTLRTPQVWKGIAARQQKRRDKSERENARLKLVLESQVKMAKSMQTLLRKRLQKQAAKCSESLHSTSFFSVQGSTLSLFDDVPAFRALLESVDRTYAELDSVFTTNGLMDSEISQQDARMREDDNGVYLDVHATKIFPFGFEAVAAAVWNHFRGNDKHHGQVYENATTSGLESADVVLEAFTMENTDDSKCAKFREKQVVRRFVESGRQVVVWVGRGHGLPHKDSPFSKFGFVEKGYVVIAPAEDNYSIVQMCTLLLPQMIVGRSIERTSAGHFTDFVLNVEAANATASQELIENVLLDQKLASKSNLEPVV